MNKDNSLSIEDRIFIISKIYDSMNLYFSGWQLVPELNIDQSYKRFINEAVKTDDRLKFGFIMMEFIAKIKNGCSGYNDKFIWANYGKPLGFNVMYYDGKWVTRDSQINQIKNFEIISKINEEDFEAFYQRQSKYISAFNDREARSKFSSKTYLFPGKFILTMADGRKINIDRSLISLGMPRLQPDGRWLKEGEIAYLKLPSFEDSLFEKLAIKYVENFKSAKILMIDLRNNSGGSVPQDLIKTLMDRPYRFWSESTSINFGLFKSYGNLLDQYGDKMSENQRNNLSFSKMFTQSSMIWPAIYEKPGSPIFGGKISILVNGNCSAEAEDFIIPFKDNKRATIIGEKTMGSTGTPYNFNFGNGISISIGTKRPYFPDGSSFDGTGISPDIGIHPNIEELKGDRDVILSEAIKMTNIIGR